MADKKISALTGATTPLAGTEVLPIVQGGATVKVAVSDLTAGRAISATAVTASTGNFVVGTSGQGVDFAATPGTGTSELLADYEEGTWTPVVSGSTIAGTYEINTGVSKTTYTKVGRLVHVSAYIVLAGAITGGGTGLLLVDGLPFAKGNNIAAWGTVAFSGVDYGLLANLSCYFGTTSSSSTILFWETNDNAGVTLTPISGVSAGDVIGFSISYEV
jgi:hypothetical protein